MRTVLICAICLVSALKAQETGLKQDEAVLSVDSCTLFTDIWSYLGKRVRSTGSISSGRHGIYLKGLSCECTKNPSLVKRCESGVLFSGEALVGSEKTEFSQLLSSILAFQSEGTNRFASVPVGFQGKLITTTEGKTGTTYSHSYIVLLDLLRELGGIKRK